MLKIITPLLLLLFLSSCATYSEEEIQSFDKQIQEYLDEKKINCEKSDSGLYFKVIKKGDGRKIKYTDEVSFKYRGELLNGRVFDDKKEPVTFYVTQLIACWKEVLLEINEGGKVFLVSPPQLGYGDHKLNDIPQNSILVFEMEVVEVK